MVDDPRPDAIFEFQGPEQYPAAPNATTMQVSGSASGIAPGDTVDIVCTYGLYGRFGRRWADPLADDVPVATDGRFSVAARVPRYPCRLRAVPAGFELPPGDGATDDADLASYAGPRVLGGAFQTRAFPADSYAPGVPVSDAVEAVRAQRRGVARVGGLLLASAGGTPLHLPEGVSGIRATYYVEDTRLRSILAFAGRLMALPPGASDQAAQITVDGAEAVLTGTALPGEKVTLESKRLDAVTGDLETVETAPIGLLTANHSGGYAVQPAGMALERTFLQDRDGRRFSFRDVFRSTDGVAHRISVQYANSVAYTYESTAQFRIPWATGDAYAVRAGSPRFGPGADGPGTMYAHIPPYPDTRPGDRPDHPGTGGEAAFSFDPKPSVLQFYEPFEFLARWTRDVPAGGSWTLKHQYAQAATRDELNTVLGFEPESASPTPSSPIETTPTIPPASSTTTPASTGTTLSIPPSIPPVKRPTAPSGHAARDPLMLLPTVPSDPVLRVSAEGRRVLSQRKRGSRFLTESPISVRVKGVPAGRYVLTVRRESRTGPTVAIGEGRPSADGTLRIAVRSTVAGRRWIRSRTARRGRRFAALVTVSWTPPSAKTRHRTLRYAVPLR